MNKTIIFLFIFLVLSSFTVAVSPHIQQSIFGTGTMIISIPVFEQIVADKPFQLNAHVYNSSGFLVDNSTTSCRFHLFNISGIHLIEEFMFFDSVGKDFYFNITAGNLTKGIYNILINCNNSQAGFFGAEIEVTSNGYAQNEFGSGLLSVLILIPLIFGLFMLIGGIAMSEDHNILRIFLFLLSVPMVWISLHWGMIGLVKYYDLLELQNAIGSMTYWLAWLFFVLVSYFIIYTIWKATETIAQEKDVRMKY